MIPKNIILASFIFCFIACQNDEKEEHFEASDISIEFNNSKVNVDSITIKAANATAKTSAYKQKAARFNLSDSINDLFDIKLYTSQGITNKKLWLKGKDIIIKGSFNPTLSIDTIINSPLYYQVQESSKKLKDLYAQGEENPAIDSFLILSIKANLDTPLSFVLADTYKYRNRDNLEALKNLASLFKEQPQNLKNHPLHISSRLNESINKLETKTQP